MSSAAKASVVFGLYVVGLGVLLVADPNLLLQPFGFAPTAEPWLRVTGLIVFALGGYYVQAGRRELTDFFRMSVAGRLFIFAGFTSFALLGWAQPQLILFGAADLLGAVWTLWA